MMIMRVLVTGLCLILHGGALGETAADANVIEETHVIRQLLLEEQIRSLTPDSNQPSDELPVLDALFEELEMLNQAIASVPEPATNSVQSIESDQAGETELSTLEETVSGPAVGREALPQMEGVKAENMPDPQPVASEPAAEQTIETADPGLQTNVAPEADILEPLESVSPVDDPMGVADALYRSGRMQMAERFYRQVLENKNPDDPAYQWALYLIAVCQTAENPAEGRKVLQSLVKAAPGCPWAAAAHARLTAQEWQEQLNPQILERMECDPNSL
jgi:tetratricopeptide (TPR) repeat protein